MDPWQLALWIPTLSNSTAGPPGALRALFMERHHQLWIPSRFGLVGSQQLAGLQPDHAKLDQKGLYVTLRGGIWAHAPGGLYVP